MSVVRNELKGTDLTGAAERMDRSCGTEQWSYRKERTPNKVPYPLK